MRVLLVEDDITTARGIVLMLKSSNAVVDQADTGEEALELARHYDYDIVVLDLMLPDMEGYEVVRRLRAGRIDVPVLILSGLTRPQAKVKGLGMGADDYITKPFEPREILARVRSVLRRDARARCGTPALSEHHVCYEFDDWVLDATTHTLSDSAGRPVVLTSGEYRMLEALVTRANRVLSRDQLMDACYGNNAPAFDRSIDVCVGRLRRKLNDDARNPRIIRTVRNGGYIFATRVTRI